MCEPRERFWQKVMAKKNHAKLQRNISLMVNALQKVFIFNIA
jgi:hypothetical protein